MSLANFILLDTNVVLDYALRREGNYENARCLFLAIAEGRVIAHVSASQITDIYFFIEKKYPPETAIEMLKTLIESIRIIRVDSDTIKMALSMPMTDFEDAVQSAAALEYDLEIVATRDRKGFLDSGLNVFTPEEFVRNLEKR